MTFVHLQPIRPRFHGHFLTKFVSEKYARVNLILWKLHCHNICDKSERAKYVCCSHSESVDGPNQNNFQKNFTEI